MKKTIPILIIFTLILSTIAAVTVSGQNPEIKDVKATPQVQWLGNPVNITANITDNIILVKINIQRDNTSDYYNANMIKGPGNSYYLDAIYECAGIYSYHIFAKNENNTNVSNLYTFTIIDNHAPNEPTNPSPANGSSNIDLDANLGWSNGDIDGDNVTYYVYFGTTSSPPWLGNTTEIYYNLGQLNGDTTYYWQIIADDGSATTPGPIWHFTTEHEPNQPPNTPSKPSGSSSGNTGTSYTYETSTTDPNGNTIMYRFDWNDGTSDDTGYYASGATVSKSHTWNTAGTYDVKVRAYDNKAWSDWSQAKTVTISEYTPPPPDNNPPNVPSKPSGPIIAETGENYTYSTDTTDVEGNDIYYWFDWDDGTNSGWIGPKTSGEECETNHSWETPDDYDVKVKAKDIYNAESGWSDSLTVKIEASSTENHAPNKPDKPSGITSGKTDISYAYTTSTVDADNDKIKYYFDWDDGTGDWTSLADSGSSVSKSHAWNTAGTYKIKVKAQDEHEKESSWSTTLTVTITKTTEDTNRKKITISSIDYYLIDEDNDTEYDQFYNPNTENTNDLGRQDGCYLIDIDNDGDWDYIYNPDQESITKYGEEEEQAWTLPSWMWWIIGGIALIIILIVIILIIYAYKRKNAPIVTKMAACPNCNTTLETSGKKGTETTVVCPNCGKKGILKL
ncbi:Y_Y_Y domain-containing protein [Thermoplasmatales archaeon SCGC AB-539-N05]|nr:Y_Y_Y domain-containing protein [Thermoplasmatales archaeon SCGC AB-539-N05]